MYLRVNVLSRLNSKPTKEAMAFGKQLVRYLPKTFHFRLVYHRIKKKQTKTVGYSDAGFSNDPSHTLKSIAVTWGLHRLVAMNLFGGNFKLGFWEASKKGFPDALDSTCVSSISVQEYLSLQRKPNRQVNMLVCLGRRKTTYKIFERWFPVVRLSPIPFLKSRLSQSESGDS